MPRRVRVRLALPALAAVAMLAALVAAPASADDTLAPVADAYVKSNNPAQNFGNATELRTYKLATSATGYRSYLKFDLTGVVGTITAAQLKLWTTSTSGSGYAAWSVADTSWVEGTGGQSGITWDNKPLLGTQLGTSGAITANTWTQVDVLAGVTAGQLGSLAITGLSSSDIHYHSKEAANDPQLVLTVTAPTTTTTTTTTLPPPSTFPQSIWTSGSASGLTDAELATFRDTLHYDAVLANPDVTVLDRVHAHGRTAIIWLGGYRDDNDPAPNCVFNTSDADLTTQVNLVKTHPATRYYFVDDEPHVGACTNSPQQMADRHALIRSLDPDPDHQTLLTENEVAAIGPLANTTDIMGLVAYPCSHQNGCQASVIQSRVNAATAAGVAHYWAMVQITQDSWYRMPTPAELAWIYDQWALTAREGEFTFMWDGGGSGEGLATHPELFGTVTAHNDSL